MHGSGFTLTEQQRLVRALSDPGRWSHPAAGIELLETHISWVILAGDYAYKLKKSLDLGFLDYSTLERRQFCCEEELRLNRRTAPELYLEVLPVGGTPEQPLPGQLPARDWLVRMRRFPAGALLSDHLTAQTVTAEAIDRLATIVARFHGEIAVAGPESPFGAPEAVQRPVTQNFIQIAERLPPEEGKRLEPLRRWSEERLSVLRGHFAARKAGGFVRECHGDLHAGNIALLDGRPVPFDGIEFNPELRWIDVISEAAFLVMDLEDRGRPDLAHRWLNRYLEETGDYAGLDLLRYYQTYRAMVRAKVSTIRRGQAGLDPAQAAQLREEFDGYLGLAERYAAASRPALLITRGVSGSGKSWGSQKLLERLGAIRIRSDVERKRLFGLAAGTRSAAAPGEGIYGAEASRRTYERLFDLASDLLQAGHRVIVDATFLQQEQRLPFMHLAETLGVPFLLLDFSADRATLCKRVAGRMAEGRDPSDADLEVMERQLVALEPLTPEEEAHRVAVPAPGVDELVLPL